MTHGGEGAGGEGGGGGRNRNVLQMCRALYELPLITKVTTLFKVTNLDFIRFISKFK